MIKIKDRVLHGIVTGIISGTPDTLLNLLQYRIGITDIKYSNMGANLFFPKNLIHNRLAQLTGMVANLILIGTAGVMYTFLLSLTGRDKALVKGIGFGFSLWVFVLGIGNKMGLIDKIKNPLSPLLSLIDHVIFGTLLGLIAPSLADQSMFPKK